MIALPRNTRPLFLALFAYCAALLSFGLYLQHFQRLEPCPMCIMQRYAFALVGIIGLVAGVHGPRSGGTRFYGGLLLLTALAGSGVAARQTWMQLYPPSIPECGPGLEYMLESFPLTSALPMIFRGAGDCSVIDWTFLGLSLANWSLLNFSAVGLFALWLLFGRRAA